MYGCENWTIQKASSVQFSRSVMSKSLRPHESQHTRPPCPWPTPGVYANSCPSSWWCQPAISSFKAPKNWCFWTEVLEKTLESPLDRKEIQSGHSKGNHSWVFIGRTDAEAETPILWPPDAKSWLIGKDPDAGRDWGQEEKGTTENEMAEWHHRLDGQEFGWTLGVGDGQGSLACYDSWGHKESDTTERLNWTELRPTDSWKETTLSLLNWRML